MTKRIDRLRKLVEVQEQLKALHEARRAGHLVAAAAAAEEAADLSRRADEGSEIGALFPDLYRRRIDAAQNRAQAQTNHANRETGLVATMTLRGKVIGHAHRDAVRQDDRETADKERLENLTRGILPERR